MELIIFSMICSIVNTGRCYPLSQPTGAVRTLKSTGLGGLSNGAGGAADPHSPPSSLFYSIGQPFFVFPSRDEEGRKCWALRQLISICLNNELRIAHRFVFLPPLPPLRPRFLFRLFCWAGSYQRWFCQRLWSLTSLWVAFEFYWATHYSPGCSSICVT